LPDETLRTLAKSFAAQARSYGFQTEDYVRFAALLLDQAMSGGDHVDMPVVEQALPLTGTSLVIRAPADDDRALLGAWLTDPTGRYFLLSRSDGGAMSVDDLMDGEEHALGVIALRDGTPVGALAYLRGEGGHRKAELRKIIGVPEYRGKGLGTEAARLWVAYGVQALGLDKIFLYTLASNLANIHVNEQLGFHVEGVLQDEVFFDGRAHDVLRMALVSAEPRD